MRTFATVILGSVILSGCAGQYAYPDLYSPVIRTPVTGTASTGNDKSAIGLSSPTEICSYPSSAITRNQANTVNSPLKGVLDRAAELQCGYAKGYKAAAQAQDFGRLPIVALAGLASLVILNDKMDAAKDAGKLGILAGVYSQSRNSLSAEDLSLSYIKGHGALTCVMAQGYRFEGKGAEIRFDAYNVLVAQHAQAMRSLTSLTTINPVPKPEADALAALTAARSIAGQAMTSARFAHGKALGETSLFANAAPIFETAIAAISVRVATAGRVRPDIDFGDLRDSFGAAPAAEPPATASVSNQAAGLAVRGKTAETLTREILVAAEALITLSGGLGSSSPNYSGALELVGKCPDEVSS